MPHHIPGYTGYLAGGQNQLGKTFGQASEAAIHERTADQDPLKWRKYVSYAEFTPAKTPSEGHHIPGYSGVVPGMYAENLYGKTYGKATLQAVEGRFPRGVEQNADEQYKTSMEVAFNMDNGHPGKPSDIGTASWAGASCTTCRRRDGGEAEPMNQWPSTVQIAGRKEPVKTSVLMHNFHEEGLLGVEQPAIRIRGRRTAQPDRPGEEDDDEAEGVYHIPGYSGFVPGVQAENIFSDTFFLRRPRRSATASAPTRSAQGREHRAVRQRRDDPALRPAKRRRSAGRDGDDAPTARTSTRHIPGYTGFSRRRGGVDHGMPSAACTSRRGKGAPAASGGR